MGMAKIKKGDNVVVLCGERGVAPVAAPGDVVGLVSHFSCSILVFSLHIEGFAKCVFLACRLT